MSNNPPTSRGSVKINRTVDGKSLDEASAATSAERQKILERGAGKILRADPYLWAIYLLFICYSIVELYSASSSEVKGDKVFAPIIQHAIYLITGFVLMLVTSKIHYKYFRKTALTFGVIAVGLLIWSSVGGVVINGAQRAIRIVGFTIQPAEIAKLALVVVLAKVIAKHQMPQGVTNMGMLVALGVTTVFCLLLFRNGLTNTLLVLLTAFSMLVIGGLQLRKIVILMAIAAVIGGPFVYHKFLSSSKEDPEPGTASEMVVTHNPAVDDGQEVVDRTELRKGRFKRFFAGVSPTDTINDDNRQVIFSKFALAHGGVIGCGPGNSRENARLPLAFSDYIFSIIIEDTGFVGGLFLLIMYLCLMGRAGQIAVKCRKAFPALLIMGCAVMIVLQALMHMSIVVGLVPVSGQPLPFISKGGTSVWVMSIAMGMMLSVSKFAVQSGKRQDEHTDLRQSVAESGEADNPTMVKPTDDKLTYN